jgi:putative endonuclease
MSYFVYILYSERADHFYIGQTRDMEQRLERHNNGYERYTSKGRPWKLLWKVEKGSRSETIRLERKLKNLSRVRLKEFMEKYSEDREP